MEERIDVDIIQRRFNLLNSQRYDIVIPNAFVGSFEADIIAVRKSGYVDELEIKLSKSDFLADFKKFGYIGKSSYQNWEKKLKHEAIEKGLLKCNYFSFILPESIVDKCEIPDYAGLYVAEMKSNGKVNVYNKKKPVKLHGGKVDDNFKYKLCQKMAYRYWQNK